jgi:hypothetical protein
MSIAYSSCSSVSQGVSASGAAGNSGDLRTEVRSPPEVSVMGMVIGSVQSTQHVAHAIVGKSTSGGSRTRVYPSFNDCPAGNLTGTFPAQILLNPPDVCSLDAPWDGALATLNRY